MNKFKANLLSIVVGANISVFFLDVRLEAASLSIITLGAIAYVFTYK
jgi:hypothetical protein